MRKIEIIEDVKLRFPGRSAEFDTGVEVGAVSVLLAQGVLAVHRELSREATEQLRPIAEKFGYTIRASNCEAEISAVSIVPKQRRPLLRVV